MRRAGWAVATIGGVALLYFLAAFDVSVAGQDGQRVVNLGLLSDRQAGLFVSGLIAAIGVFIGVMTPAAESSRLSKRAILGLSLAALLVLLAWAFKSGLLATLWERSVLSVFD